MYTRNMKLLLTWFSLVMIFSLALAGCTPPAAAPATEAVAEAVAEATLAEPTQAPEPTKAPEATQVPDAAQAPVSTELILATTTSTRDSGLLDVLLPLFEKASGYKVKMVAVGSGEALKMGSEGNADVLLVHSPAAEKDLMDQGFGKERLLIMHNDYIIVGPKEDPAGIKDMTVAVDAFKKIAEAKAIFVSRGDQSGTNTKELGLWKAASITPEGDWYVQSGQGMGDTLRITSEKAGYTLTDRASFLALRDTLQLDILVQGDKGLLNIYHVITVNPDKWPKVNYAGAKAFADFLVSADIQKLISEFGVDKFGEPLFFPDAGKSE